MTTKTKERTSRMVVRAVVLKGGRGVTYGGLPAHVGAHIPWEPQYQRLINLGFLAKTKVDAADLTPCPHHEGLEFLSDETLQRHLKEDEARIEELRADILKWMTEADRQDRFVESTSAADPIYHLQLDADVLADRDRKRAERDAKAARKKAADCRAELEKMGVQ